MINIEDTLKAYGLTKEQIDRYLNFYNFAITRKIPYPHYYAITKLFV